MKPTFKEKVTAAKALILKMYLDGEDNRDWAVAFSGGKDSTAVTGLMVSVIAALPKEKRTRKIHCVMSNTVVENPLVHDHMEEQARLINAYCEKHELPITVSVVSRDLEESYFVKVLGLGYPLPMSNGKNRWCTDRLKIKPQNEHLKEIDPSYILTGVRDAESAARAKSIDKWRISEFIGDHVDLKQSHTFNPIVNWTIQDVWKFLEMDGLPWGSTLSVRTIYKDATGECGFSNPEGTEKAGVEVCGARHGCWLCPVILKDKSTEKMSEKHTWLEPLTEWRMTQLKVYGKHVPNRPEGMKRPERSAMLRKQEEVNLQIKIETKSGHMRNGKKLKDGDGTLTVHARKYLFEKLLETEALVNRMRKWDGLERISLISFEEMEMIQKMWNEDTIERPYLIGEPLSDIAITLIEGE